MYRVRSAKIPLIVLAMVVTLVASAIFQIYSYRNAKRVEEIGSRDAHVRDVLTALAALKSARQEALIGQNGYLLTGESRELQLYRSAAARMPDLLEQVRALTAEDPAQVELARRLQSLVETESLDLTRGLHSTRQQKGPGTGCDPGAELDPTRADQIPRILDRMTDWEQQVRADCLAQTQAAAATQAHSLIAASIYRVFVLLSGCTLILHQQKRQWRAEQLCRQSEEFFRNALDHAATGMVLADQSGRWLKVNRALCELLGYSEEELLRIASCSITQAEDLERERAAVEELRAGRSESHQLEMRYIHKGGHTVWALVTMSLVRDEHGRPQTLISQIQDHTERKRAEDRLRHQSQHDALTGLPNRLLLDERIRRGIERAHHDPDFRLAMLFLDLDGFKLINDSLGHAAGDELLITVAQRLRQCVRSGDLIEWNGSGSAAEDDSGIGTGHTVARLAGDEFTILLEGFRAPDDAERVAERILQEFGRPVEIGGQQIRAAASIGIVHASGPRYTAPSQLLADADAALYKAKAAGRGRYAVFDADAQQSALERLRMAGELRRALEHEQFVLHYQPIVSLLDRHVAGFEVLLRWQHPERGLLASEQFIDLAEESGLIVPLGNWVLQEAGRQLGEWTQQRQRPFHLQPEIAATTARADTFMIVGLSPKQLVDQGLVQRVRDLQQLHALGDGWLRVTIAEPVLMQNPDGVNGILKELKSAGARAWVRNFGSGVTSLGCMRSNALDGLKIDARVVGSTAGRRDSAAVVHSVLELARNLRLQVVADGLETAEQVTMLQAMGCDLGQGSYFGPPLTATEAGISLDACSPKIPARPA